MMIELVDLQTVNPIEIAKIANNPNVCKYNLNSFPSPYSVEDAIKFQEFSEKNNQLDLAILYNGVFAGIIGAKFKKDVYYRSVEVGYWLGEEFWHKGIATHSVELFTQMLFDEYHIHKIKAEVFHENIYSSQVLLRNGFTLEGCLKDELYKDGHYYDALIYGKIKE